MTREIFTKRVEDLILPLFTGSEIISFEESSSRDSEVALGEGGSVLIKPSKVDEYRLKIKRSQPFKNSDVNLLKAIISELNKITELGISEPTYLNRLYKTAIEKAICQSVSDVAHMTLLNIITELDTWANRTYEGKRMSFGIIINEVLPCQNPVPNLHHSKVFKSDFFALLSNGIQTCVEIDKDGFVLGHILLEKLRFAPTICPYEYINMARFCDEKRVGVTLLEGGEILIFKNRELLYCKKRGTWGSYCHDEIIQLLSNRTSHTMKEIRKAIYFTALDCSFIGSGGCLVYLNKDMREQALKHINIDDILTENHFELKKTQELEESRKLYNFHEETFFDENTKFEDFIDEDECIKSSCLKKVIDGRKFHELNRKLRQEIAGMDGATIIDWDGTIIAAGAIVKIEAGSTGGGRLAATKTLAKYGVAIKISTDGTIQAFMKEKRENRVKAIFTVG